MGTHLCHLQIGRGDPDDASGSERGGGGRELGWWSNRVERTLRFRQRLSAKWNGSTATTAETNATSSSSSRREAKATGSPRNTERRHSGRAAYIQGELSHVRKVCLSSVFFSITSR